MQLKEKNVLVTGAARRGGKAIALELAKRGANVVIHYYRSADAAKELTQRIKKMGRRAWSFRADLRKVREIDRLVSRIRSDCGPVDILVNNAADFYRTPFSKISEKDWDDFFDTNLKGPFFLSQIIGQQMKKKGGGVIMNVADWAGLHLYRHYLPYSLSKAGLIAATKGLARALGPKVQVYALAPRRLKSFMELASAVMKILQGRGIQSGATYTVDGKRLLG